MFILKMSFRNICRHKRRSFVNILLIFVSVSVVFATALFCNTVNSNMNKAVVESCTGDLQLHSKQQEEIDIYSSPPADTVVFSNADSIINQIKEVDEILYLTQRLRVQGLLMGKSESTSAVLTGIHPKIEKLVSPKIKIIEGTYITKNNGVIIGKILQENMNIKLNDKIKYYINKADGSITEMEYIVEGIFMSDGLGMYMDTYMFGDLDYMRSSLNYNNDEVTEVVVRLNENTNKNNAVNKIQTLLDNGEYDIKVNIWEDFSETYSSVIVATTLIPLAVNLFVIFVVIFGLFNMIILNVLERVKEYSIMHALGTSRLRIVEMFFFEFFVIGLISVIAAMCILIPTALIFGKMGISAQSEIMAYIFGGYKLYIKMNYLIVIPIVIIFSIIPALIAAVISYINMNKLMLSKMD